MPLPTAPELHVCTVVKADEQSVGLTDVHTRSDGYGNLSVRSNSRIVKNWKCWVREDESEAETWFLGSGENRYREGHRVVLAYYDRQLMGHHNVTTNDTSIVSPQVIPGVAVFIKLSFLFFFVSLLAPISLLFSLRSWLSNADNLHKEIPYPGADSDAKKHSRNVSIVLGFVSLCYLGMAVTSFVSFDLAIKAFGAAVLALTIMHFIYYHKACKARAEFQAEVVQLMAKAGRADQAKRKANNATASTS